MSKQSMKKLKEVIIDGDKGVARFTEDGIEMGCMHLADLSVEDACKYYSGKISFPKKLNEKGSERSL